MNQRIILAISAIVIASMIGVLAFNSTSPSLIADDGNATPEGVAQLVAANNQYSLELYDILNGEEEGNIFFSPYSISTALAMTQEGARGQTAKEIQSVFHFPENIEEGRPNHASLYNKLNPEDTPYKLHTTNALWAQTGYTFLPTYFDTVETYYGGKVTELDFKKKPEKSRKTINTWVEDKTEDKIKGLIPKGMINPDLTRLVLTNAIYFKGNWVQQFNEKDTRDREFRISPTNAIQTPMMQRTDEKARYNYTENSKLQVLELPYTGDDLSMLILLPIDEDLNSLERSITTKKLEEWKNELGEQQVNIFIPKFKFETKYFMKKTLEEQGMPTAFSDNFADFSGMTGQQDLKIDEVIHQAFVEVNEEGTEAAAATAVIMGRITSVGSEPAIPVFRADHPFIFIIQHKETGTILFMGRVADPR